MSDLFDVFNLSDIPVEIGDIKKDSFANDIVELFKIAKRELSVDEVTVGYYRKFSVGEKKAIKTKTQIMNKLYALSRDDSSPIFSVEKKKGVYNIQDNIKLNTEEKKDKDQEKIKENVLSF